MTTHAIDYAALMDLTVDYAFKLLYGTGKKKSTQRLISLLNAVFANKGIPRVISGLTVVNPAMEKGDAKDKLSILDIHAVLDDGSQICIEMHLYGIDEFKLKSIRNWARTYSDELESGDKFTNLKPVICISFTDDAIRDIAGNPLKKTHSLFYITERDDGCILTGDLEFHYIGLKEFVLELMANNGIAPNKLARWLALITNKRIADKSIIERICGEDSEIMGAVRELDKNTKDKFKRLAYQRRQDELRSYNGLMDQLAEKDTALAEKDATITEKDTTIAEQGFALSEKDAALAKKDAMIAEQDTALSEKDATIAMLRAQLEAAIK